MDFSFREVHCSDKYICLDYSVLKAFTGFDLAALMA